MPRFKPFPARAAALLAAVLLLAAALPAPARAAAVKRGLVILAEFPDVPNKATRDFVVMRFCEHLTRYVAEASGGAVDLRVDVAPAWKRLPRPVESYRISPRNLEVDRSRVVLLIDDALGTLPADVDLGAYDFIAVMLGAKMSEYGMVGLCGYPGMLGWSSEGVFRTSGGREVRGGVAIFTTQAHPGTLFHDVAHILGGVRDGKRMMPCLYDHDLQARPGPVHEVFESSLVNMGYWDPMSCHFYKRMTPPPGISSWTRLRLGWLDEAKVRTVQPGQAAEVVLGPLADPASEVAAVRIPLSETTFYLLENRQPVGYDQYLPGSGVLVLFADDTVAECRHGKSPVQLMDANPSVPHLEGAAFDVGGRDTFVDAQRKVRVRLLEKVGRSYRIAIDSP